MKLWTLRSAAAAQALPETMAAQAVPEVAEHPLPAAVPVPVLPPIQWAVVVVVAAMRLLSGALVGL